MPFDWLVRSLPWSDLRCLWGGGGRAPTIPRRNDGSAAWGRGCGRWQHGDRHGPCGRAGDSRRSSIRWRWRGLGVGLGCGFGRWPGGLRQQENIPEVAQQLARGMPQAVIADLVEAGRQDVLEEAPDELVAGHGLRALAVGGAVLVAIGHRGVVDGQDAVVGDGDAEGVAGEIVERCLLSLAPWRDVNDPGDLPDMGRQVGGRAEPGEGVAEAGAGQGGERRLWEQKGLAGGMPDGAVIGQAAAGDEAVNVRVEAPTPIIP